MIVFLEEVALEKIRSGKIWSVFCYYFVYFIDLFFITGLDEGIYQFQNIVFLNVFNLIKVLTNLLVISLVESNQYQLPNDILEFFRSFCYYFQILSFGLIQTTTIEVDISKSKPETSIIRIFLQH